MRHDHDARLTARMKHKIELDEIILAEVRGRRIGYLRLEYLWMKIPYIGLILVLPSFRRRGIGRAMLNFLQRYLRGTNHVVLLSSSQVNESIPSQAWHRKMGFEECGVLNGVNEKWVGELFFRKSLVS